jgi:hypothetical protein
LELGRCIKSGNRPYADLVKSGYNNTNKAQSLMILLYVWLYNVYEYFLLKIVRYLFTNFSIPSIEETPKRGAFSIHNNP